MAVKYICPVCGRRFVDWGAEKLGYKCPGDECKEETLIVVGSNTEEKEEKPTLKRSRKRKTITPPAPEVDIAEMDRTFVESDDADDEEDEDEEEDAVAVVADDDIDEDALLDDDDAVDDEEDDTFTDALDIEGDDDVSL